jgi:hypothetical protein
LGREIQERHELSSKTNEPSFSAAELSFCGMENDGRPQGCVFRRFGLEPSS